MTQLPSDFQFSQASLQDYVDCPRRFQLRYVLQLKWPAIEVQPALENERHMQQGAAFHQLVQRHVLGLQAEVLTRTTHETDLRRWWHNYLEHGLDDLPDARYPEVVLSAPLASYRLIARYDLVAVGPERGVIVDWKTNRKRPRRQALARRLQTRVYPFLLIEAGAHLNDGRPFAPEQVEMIYWFADHPHQPARFPYDAAQCQADRDDLTALIEDIAARGEEDYPLTDDARRCKFCPYRSLCQRGVEPGSLDEAQDEAADLVEGDRQTEIGIDFDLDFDQIAEIEF